jgi:hypothetical protein
MKYCHGNRNLDRERVKVDKRIYSQSYATNKERKINTYRNENSESANVHVSTYIVANSVCSIVSVAVRIRLCSPFSGD